MWFRGKWSGPGQWHSDSMNLKYNDSTSKFNVVTTWASLLNWPGSSYGGIWTQGLIVVYRARLAAVSLVAGSLAKWLGIAKALVISLHILKENKISCKVLTPPYLRKPWRAFELHSEPSNTVASVWLRIGNVSDKDNGFQYFRQCRIYYDTTLAKEKLGGYKHCSAPGLHMWASPGPRLYSKCFKTVEVRCSGRLVKSQNSVNKAE